MKYSIVIPAYNEEERITQTLRKLMSEFRDDAEYIVVDDGSSDSTAKKAREMGAKVISHKANRGKGAAIRTGFGAARGDTIGFVDADESTSAKDAKKAFNEAHECDVAIATRKYPGAKIQVKQPPMRILAGDMFHILTEALFGLGIRDTQCGCKVFKAAAGKRIAQKMVSDGFEFDVEMLYLAKKFGFEVKLVPIVWKHEDNSKLSIAKHGPRMLFGLLRLKARYLLK